MIKHGLLGNTIRNARIEKGLSQEELAEKVEITPTHLKHIESEHRKPSIEVLFRLMEVLRFSLDNLIFETSEKDEEIRNIENKLTDCSIHELRIINGIIGVIKAGR